jgi:predicted Zn-dependent peptidase
MLLRERNGMAYNVESSYTSYFDTGAFTVYFGTDKENMERALRLVNKEFKKMKEQAMGTLQLSRAKRQLIGQLAISTENREDLMLSLGKSLMFFNRVDSMKLIIERIENISGSEILEVANELFEEPKRSILIYQ